jgi:hypothetical protein
LQSYAAKLRVVQVTHPVDNVPVLFIDMPGFNDMHKSDAEILKKITKFLMKK